MRLEKALNKTKENWNTKDILEILWMKMIENYDTEYYNEKISRLPKWEYFISDLDWTFFRWTLQKEAVSLFIKFVISKSYYNINPEKYFEFIKDLEFFNSLERKALNKEISFWEYLNSWIYFLLKHKNLIDWEDFLNFIKYSFKEKEKIKPFRFSMKKLKEVIDSGKIFLFVSWAPDFIFEIYIELLKNYIEKNIWKSASNNIYGFWTNIWKKAEYFIPLWWREHKKIFINILKEKQIITKTIWWMWDTWWDFGISDALDNWNDFFFINPERKVLEKFEELKTENIDFKMIIERKDFIWEIDRKSVIFMN